MFERLVYGFHPYGLPGTGHDESLARDHARRPREFHDRYFAPNNAILAVVGDVTADEAFAAVDRVFGDWPRREVPAARGRAADRRRGAW